MTREAPLYTQAHALALDLLPRLFAWRAAGHTTLADAAGAAAITLLTSVGHALAFPDRRAAALADADAALVDLRLLGRLGEEPRAPPAP